jgi:hypothetical protein
VEVVASRGRGKPLVVEAICRHTAGARERERVSGTRHPAVDPAVLDVGAGRRADVLPLHDLVSTACSAATVADREAAVDSRAVDDDCGSVRPPEQTNPDPAPAAPAVPMSRVAVSVPARRARTPSRTPLIRVTLLNVSPLPNMFRAGQTVCRSARAPFAIVLVSLERVNAARTALGCVRKG